MPQVSELSDNPVKSLGFLRPYSVQSSEIHQDLHFLEQVPDHGDQH